MDVKLTLHEVGGSIVERDLIWSLPIGRGFDGWSSIGDGDASQSRLTREQCLDESCEAPCHRRSYADGTRTCGGNMVSWHTGDSGLRLREKRHGSSHINGASVEPGSSSRQPAHHQRAKSRTTLSVLKPTFAELGNVATLAR